MVSEEQAETADYPEGYNANGPKQSSDQEQAAPRHEPVNESYYRDLRASMPDASWREFCEEQGVSPDAGS